jgi:hypothetical protein
MLERDDGLYRDTAETDLFLDRAKPSYVGGQLEMANARLYPFWGSLTEGLRTGQPQNEAKNGGDFFAVLYQDPQRLEQFLRAMSGLSMGAAVAISQKFNVGEVRDGNRRRLRPGVPTGPARADPPAPDRRRVRPADRPATLPLAGRGRLP